MFIVLDCRQLSVDTHSIYKNTWSDVMKGWAWQASLSLNFRILNVPLFKCMGVLVHNEFVLTTGHCLKFGSYITVDREKLFISLGGKLNDYRNGTENRQVKSLIFHDTLDLALIHLLTSVDISPDVQPICLLRDEGDIDVSINENLVAVTWFSNEE